MTTTSVTRAAAPVTAALYVPVDTTDAELVELWLHGKVEHTQHAYRAHVGRFLVFSAKPLRTITLADVQAFADSLHGTSQRRALAAIKSHPGTHLLDGVLHVAEGRLERLEVFLAFLAGQLRRGREDSVPRFLQAFWRELPDDRFAIAGVRGRPIRGIRP